MYGMQLHVFINLRYRRFNVVFYSEEKSVLNNVDKNNQIRLNYNKEFNEKNLLMTKLSYTYIDSCKEKC